MVIVFSFEVEPDIVEVGNTGIRDSQMHERVEAFLTSILVEC